MPVGEAESSSRRWRPPLPLANRLLEFRDRLLASPRFQRVAAEFPLTRGIARRRSAALFDLCAGFVYSQTLLACVRLGLFDILAEGPSSRATLSARLALPADATLTLLRAAAALGLVEGRGEDRYGLGPLGAPLAGDSAIAAMIEHHAILYGDLHDPVALLRDRRRDTALRRFWGYALEPDPARLDEDDVAPYTAVMAASQRLVAEQALAAHDFRQCSRLLDVGGGNGAFLAAVGGRFPHLALTLFDLPAVAAKAERNLAKLGLGPRTRVIPGDFLSDPVPAGADTVSLVRILHDHPDEAAARILSAVRAALPAGGRLLVVEPLSAPREARVSDAYFGLYLHAMGQGRVRSFAELRTLVLAAGFMRAKLVRTPLPLVASVVVAVA